MNCPECGKPLTKKEKYCSNCGHQIEKEKKERVILDPLKEKTKSSITSTDLGVKGIIGIGILAFLTLILFTIMKTSIIGWILVIIVFIVCAFLQKKVVGTDLNKAIILIAIPIVITPIVFVTTTNFNDNTNIPNSNINTNSSIVSQGVNMDDLGNIFNGQYFFDDGTNQFYSTFDNSGATHIYVTNKSTGQTKKIFDGFGWSFVVHDGWLYFSGNQGTKIDATYNMFRMKTDGSGLEKINSDYSYNMNFYKQWLYYIKQDNHDAEVASVYRSLVDGSEETEIISNMFGLSVIYENKLYYLSSDSHIYTADPDGNNKKQIISDTVEYFIIGQGRVLYVDDNNNIKSSKIDGTDIKIIKPSDGGEIFKINSYKNTIFYIKVGDYANERLAYRYTIGSIKNDGTNDKKVYDGVSWGYYVNILNDKIFVLDYAQDLIIDKFIAIARNMNLDGSNVTDLSR